MLSLQQLRSPMTRKDVLTSILSWMQALGFDTTGWQPGRIQKTLLTAFSLLGSDFTETAKQNAEFGFNDYATGEPLVEFSKSRYDNVPDAAVATAGPMRLTSTATIPYTILPGQLIGSTDAGVQFRNTTGGTLAAGGTLDLQWQCTLQGELGNVASGFVNRLLTPLAGVSISNSIGTPWYTTTGKDQESDASLRQKNSTKWSRLSVELIADAYKNIAINAGAVKVALDDQNPRGAGTINVYVSAERSLLDNTTMQVIQTAFAERTFGTDATWDAVGSIWTGNPASRVAVLYPPNQVLNVTATIYHDPAAVSADVVSAARQALTDLLTRTPIGGNDYSPGPSNVITLDEIYDVFNSLENVRTVTLTTPNADLAVGTLTLVIEGVWSITAVPVTS